MQEHAGLSASSGRDWQTLPARHPPPAAPLLAVPSGGAGCLSRARPPEHQLPKSGGRFLIGFSPIFLHSDSGEDNKSSYDRGSCYYDAHGCSPQ